MKLIDADILKYDFCLSCSEHATCDKDCALITKINKQPTVFTLDNINSLIGLLNKQNEQLSRQLEYNNGGN